MSVLSNVIDALQTTNVREGARMDPLSKWLVITRASVFPMTFSSACIGGLLAVPGGDAHLGYFALCTLGLLLAHAANNMINDWFDTESGVDTPEYARALYAPHPILAGLVSKRGLLAAILGVNALDLAIAGWLTAARGWPIAAFAIAGFAISVFYVAPPLRLKHHGLGEPAVAIVWGPLMIAGTYFATAGALPGWVWWASLPYGLLVMTVLFGKHIDKAPADREKGIRTLPVLLGDERARLAVRGMIVAFFALVVAEVALGVLGVWVLAVLLAIPRARAVLRTFREPRPASPPPGYPVWPLWYVSWAFGLTRSTGGLFAAGLVLDALFTVHL
jgi:1,4-dihydroxy-2-naphthoate octaprenyltransferase